MVADEILTYAEAVARKKGHAHVRDVHVLVALCTRRDVQERLNRDAYSLKRLDDLVRAALAAEPDQRGYRTDVAPAISDELRAVVTAKRGFFRRAPSAVDIFDALSARLDLAATRFDPASVVALYDAAAKVTRLRGHRNVLLDHALVALAAEDGRFRRALAALGKDPEETRRALRARLTRRLVGVKLPPPPRLTMLAATLANASHRRELDCDALVLRLMRAPLVDGAFAAMGVARDRFFFAFVHGLAWEPPAHVGAGTVVFHDDDFTTMEEVSRVLVAHFGKSAAEAKELVKAVHEGGTAEIAVENAAAAIVAAHAAAPTLRLELRHM